MHKPYKMQVLGILMSRWAVMALLGIVLLAGCSAPKKTLETCTPSGLEPENTTITYGSPIQLSFNTVEDWDPTVSSDGRWVFWQVDNTGSYVSDALAFAPSSGGNVSVLTFNELLSAPDSVTYTSSFFIPSVSWDGSIAITIVNKKVNQKAMDTYIFVYNRTSGIANLLERDGEPVTNQARDKYANAESVVPIGAYLYQDGSRIITIVDVLRPGGILIENAIISMNVDGSDLKVVKDGISRFFNLKLSGDGKKIAYQENYIWTLLPDNVKLPRYVDTFGGFSWNWDGSRIVSADDSIITVYDGNGGVIQKCLGFDSPQALALGVDMYTLHEPSISGDGSRILFYDEENNLYAINYNGTGMTKVVDRDVYGEVNGGIWQEVPMSNDGNVFVFRSEYKGNSAKDYEIFSVIHTPS